MSIYELPLMTEDTSIEDAFNHLVNTGKGAIVVKMTDGARIFPAQHLHLQLPGEASKSLREAAGGLWCPESDADTILEQHLDIALLDTSSNRAKVSVLSDNAVIRGMFLALKTYTCNGPSKHKYYPWQLSSLKPAGTNRWECMNCTRPPVRYVT